MSTDISKARGMAGFLGACLVDGETGLMLASEGGYDLDLEAASALNTQVVRAKKNALEAMGLDDDIEDILITLGKQYHLIRPLESNPKVFMYVALEKASANLGMARLNTKQIERSLTL